MQISLLSPTHCSSGVNEKPARFARGFTLVELLISIGIIGLVTGIVLVKHRSFDSTVLLKAEAYDIALAIREMQVKAVSATRNSTTTNDNVTGHNNSDFPWGVTFSDDIGSGPDRSAYVSFRYNSASTTALPLYAGTRVISTTTLERGAIISDVCIELTPGNEDCDITRLDISFRRPEYRALFYTTGGGHTTQQLQNAVSGKVVIRPADATADAYTVTVSRLGQITVQVDGS